MYQSIPGEDNSSLQNVHVHGITDVSSNVSGASYFANVTILYNTTELGEIREFEYVPRYSFPVLVFIVVLLGCMIISTIIGNVFVIAAILIEKSLQGVSNYLILSLAITDLMVAVLVMPISLVNQVSVHWYLGGEVCDMWVSFDVLCCTASILHLVAISLDRFWAVSNIDYIRRRCARQILIMIAIVWIVSISISVAPIFGWRDPGNNPEVIGTCMISQDLGYTVFSTVGAFYFPLLLMLILNFKIYLAARSRIRKKHIGGLSRPPVGCPTITQADGTTRNNSSGSDVSHDEYTVYNGSCIQNDEETNFNNVVSENGVTIADGQYLSVPTTNVYVLNKQLNPPKAVNNNNHKRMRRKDRERARKAKMEMKRERKAARVLGIITGAFVACWLPFFVIALVGPFCGASCFLHFDMISFFLWLGYFNSLLNPIIYTVFNPSFRTAFRKLIFRKYSRRLR